MTEKEGTKIMNCKNCISHEFQDQKYGKNMRIFNRGGNAKSNVPTWTCTVCGKKAGG